MFGCTASSSFYGIVVTLCHWKYFRVTDPLSGAPQITVGFPLQRASNAKFWCAILCLWEQWNCRWFEKVCMTLLMWWQCNAEKLTYTKSSFYMWFALNVFNNNASIDSRIHVSAKTWSKLIPDVVLLYTNYIKDAHERCKILYMDIWHPTNYVLFTYWYLLLTFGNDKFYFHPSKLLYCMGAVL